MIEDIVSVSIRIECLCGHAISEKIGLPVPSGHISMCPDRKDKPQLTGHLLPVGRYNHDSIIRHLREHTRCRTANM